MFSMLQDNPKLQHTKGYLFILHYAKHFTMHTILRNKGTI